MVIKIVVENIHIRITFCYRQPLGSLDDFGKILELATAFLHHPAVLRGDFISHSFVWDERNDKHGKVLLDFMTASYMELLNVPYGYTFLNSRE